MRSCFFGSESLFGMGGSDNFDEGIYSFGNQDSGGEPGNCYSRKYFWKDKDGVYNVRGGCNSSCADFSKRRRPSYNKECSADVKYTYVDLRGAHSDIRNNLYRRFNQGNRLH
jgi:hypothetical protein